MTRFARAKGSKSSNERAPEDSTPWEVMKDQLMQAKKDGEESKKREQAEKQRIENYENFLKEHKTQKRKATWCDFPESQISILSKSNQPSEPVKKKNKPPNQTEPFHPTQGQSSQPEVSLQQSKKKSKKKKPTNILENQQSYEVKENSQITESKMGQKKNKNSMPAKDSEEQNPPEAGQPENKRKKNKKQKVISEEPTENTENNRKKNKKQKVISEEPTENTENNRKKNKKQKVISEEPTENTENNRKKNKKQKVISEEPTENTENNRKKNKKQKVISEEPTENTENNRKKNKKQKVISEEPTENTENNRKKNKKQKVISEEPTENTENNRKKNKKQKVISEEPTENTENNRKKNKKQKVISEEPTENTENNRKKNKKQKVISEDQTENNHQTNSKHNDGLKNNQPTKQKKKKRINGEPARRKPVNDNSFQLIINGKEIELVRYDGFPIMKKDVERLEELKTSMVKKGIPKSEVQRTMKLERRRAEKALARVKRDVCYNCRKGGHNLSDCPELKTKIPGVGAPDGLCFKCGSTEHRQFECKVQRDKEFRFATCFICKEPGHIARQCPDNPKGLYPNGGSCKLCGDVTHLRKDCPTVQDKREDSSIKLHTLDPSELEEIPQKVKGTGGDEPAKKPKKITF